MDDLTLRYFEEEMRYLREAGKEFALAHPDRAAMLNLDKVGARDPYVERLFEGFSFLMGRLREKLDDDLPELTEGLVSLLWPYYLRTIPSLSIVEFDADWQRIKGVEVVNRGFEVISQPIGAKKTRCCYTTTQTINLNPIHLSKATLSSEADGRSIIRLRFEVGRLSDWDEVDLSQISIYLDADDTVACALHQALTLQAQAVYLRVPEQASRQRIKSYFSPGGFSDEERLWPKSDSAFSGYQLLLEFFTFRKKFMFVTLNGLDKTQLPEKVLWFEIDVVLSEQWLYELPFSAENLRLHCVPVINLFQLESDPLTPSALQSEYLLRPMRLQDGHMEIYSVDSVISSKDAGNGGYVPFSSFRHKGGMLRFDAPQRYYHTRVKRNASGLYDTWLILGGEAFGLDNFDVEESLSLTLTGTNGQLPRKALQSTLLDSVAESSQMKIKVRNLCAPTMPCYPPTQDRFHWRVLSHLGSNFLPMMDNAEVLRSTLSLYDWSENELNYRRLAAIIDVKHHLIQRFEKGFLLRGVEIVVTLDSLGFSGEGDIHLFGEMLSRFFELYADIHLFNQLTLILQPSGKILRWKEKHSQHIPG